MYSNSLKPVSARWGSLPVSICVWTNAVMASRRAVFAAAVAAARGAYAADTVSDPYFVAFSAFAEHPADHHYRAQNAVLLELIGDSTGTRT
ncbi:hypothetical protein [Streptomyces violaceusniger]|uniref:hypothetical protein n=1 Tax=Streptomyces violaceusniger TaxID=68280 RepID=UPI003823248F